MEKLNLRTDWQSFSIGSFPRLSPLLTPKNSLMSAWKDSLTLLCGVADLQKLLGPEGPFTETELRARLAELGMSTADIESRIARARAYPKGSAADQ